MEGQSLSLYKHAPGATPQKPFILFRTELFLYHQEDEDIDRWRVGGDCAGWFYVRLLQGKYIQHCHCPVMEDWGWIFSVIANSVQIDIRVWQYCADFCWVLGVETHRSFWANPALASQGHVTDRLEKIVSGDARFTKHQWFEANPFDLMTDDF
jgi:hypothetical protein